MGGQHGIEPDPSPVRRCPSHRADDAEVILGVIGPDGTLGHLQPPLAVTAARLGRLREAHGELLEATFRFAGPCHTSGCASWRGDHCGVVEEVLAEHPAMPDVSVTIGRRLPHCTIRPTCRWWAERGRAACDACPLVATAALREPA